MPATPAPNLHLPTPTVWGGWDADGQEGAGRRSQAIPLDPPPTKKGGPTSLAGQVRDWGPQRGVLG